ncbi:hypothetical protein B0T16DRAFT_449585 [Cercophora newfieldiana]|uniref:Uncharacterized protein n=1 Tax=Cercophora newfieldiana TaxID=92897 RepID=A0AA40CH43_9PEZI|nr:hypothetical protein B0T16DRAFT_449585 [Cercophora newfieldiana]
MGARESVYGSRRGCPVTDTLPTSGSSSAPPSVTSNSAQQILKRARRPRTARLSEGGSPGVARGAFPSGPLLEQTLPVSRLQHEGLGHPYLASSVAAVAASLSANPRNTSAQDGGNLPVTTFAMDNMSSDAASDAASDANIPIKAEPADAVTSHITAATPENGSLGATGDTPTPTEPPAYEAICRHMKKTLEDRAKLFGEMAEELMMMAANAEPAQKAETIKIIRGLIEQVITGIADPLVDQICMNARMLEEQTTQYKETMRKMRTAN